MEQEIKKKTRAYLYFAEYFISEDSVVQKWKSMNWNVDKSSFQIPTPALKLLQS